MSETRTRDPDELLTVEEVARIVKASVSTVRNWIRTGELRSVKAGRLRRVRASDLQVMLVEDEEKFTEEDMAYWEQRFPVWTGDNPYMQLVGIGDSGLTDVSMNHDRYAYRKDWEER